MTIRRTVDHGIGVASVYCRAVGARLPEASSRFRSWSSVLTRNLVTNTGVLASRLPLESWRTQLTLVRLPPATVTVGTGASKRVAACGSGMLKLVWVPL